MREIEDALVIRVAMDRAHESVRDAEFVMQNLCHRRKAVGSAAGIGNNLIFPRVVDIVVDTDANRRVGVFCWRADQHSFGASF